MGNNGRSKLYHGRVWQYIQMTKHKSTTHTHHYMVTYLFNFDYL